MQSKLVFVYNGDTGKLNALMDMGHKLLSPSTYPCSLCDITHNTFAIKKEWSDYLERKDHHYVFLHRNEFHSFYPKYRSIDLPLFMNVETGEILLTKHEMDKFKHMDDLILWLESHKL
jgi:hypothetical protein